jgi:hypothetical protein
MATIDTATPTVTARDHRPARPEATGETLAGNVNLATKEGWTYLSSFVVGGLSVTAGTDAVDITQGRVARAEDGTQEMLTVGSVFGLGIASSGTSYIYFRTNDIYEVRDADEPPEPGALLVATVEDGEVDEDVRGRSPISQFALAGSDDETGTGAGGGGAYSNAIEDASLASSGGSESFRVTVADGDRLRLTTAGVHESDNSNTSGLQANVVDETNSTTLYSTENKLDTGDPLASIRGPVDLRFEITNTTGSSITASGLFAWEFGDADTGDLIDDFEDGGLTEYTTSGPPAVVTGGAYNETHYLLTEATESAFSLAGGGLPNYPDQGEDFESYVYLSASGSQPNFRWGVQDASNYYAAEADGDNGELVLKMSDGGTLTTLQSTSVSVPSTQWLRIAVEWTTSGGMTVTLVDPSDALRLAQVSATDSTFTDGGVGFSEESALNSSRHDFAREVIGGLGTGSTAAGIDDVEDADIDEYLGDTGGAQVVGSNTGEVIQGAYSIELTGDGSGVRIYSLEGDSDPDLPNYPAQDDIFEARVFAESGAIPAILWGVQDASNLYGAEADSANNAFRFFKLDGGTRTDLEAGFPTIPSGEWLTIEVEWRTDGQHTITLFDASDTQLDQLQTTDTTYTSGGWGWQEDS